MGQRGRRVAAAEQRRCHSPTAIHRLPVHARGGVGRPDATFACDLRQDAGNVDSPIVATEVCGTSITSQGRPAGQIETLLRENSDIHNADASRRGYTVLDIARGEARVAARVIDDATVRTTGVGTARTFTIERDRPGIQL